MYIMKYVPISIIKTKYGLIIYYLILVICERRCYIQIGENNGHNKLFMKLETIRVNSSIKNSINLYCE